MSHRQRFINSDHWHLVFTSLPFNSTRCCIALGTNTMARPAKRRSVSASEEPDDEVEESPVRYPDRLVAALPTWSDMGFSSSA
jgi:hypothetical protein